MSVSEKLKDSPVSQHTKSSFSRQNSDIVNGILSGPESNTRKSSILKNTSRFQNRKREDNFGKEIKQNSKEHKICFSENLCEVNEVENWKKYNVEDEMSSRTCCKVF